MNAIGPGFFPSEVTTKDSKENQKREIPREKYAHLPTRRPCNNCDVAIAVHFCYDESISQWADYTGGRGLFAEIGFVREMG